MDRRSLLRGALAAPVAALGACIGGSVAVAGGHSTVVDTIMLDGCRLTAWADIASEQVAVPGDDRLWMQVRLTATHLEAAFPDGGIARSTDGGDWHVIAKGERGHAELFVAEQHDVTPSDDLVEIEPA